ncbi:MAG: LytTR family transcriptional regulator [Clostridia bacterium]|nr:LytTR family transcriptional regulator [Clostridia bacterium]
MKYKLIIDKNAEEEVVVRVHAPSPLTAQIEALVLGGREESGLVGYADGEMRRLSPGEIECITVIDRRVVAIDLENKRYRLQERLRELEERLPPNFIRINKSTLANEDRIQRFEAAFSGGVDAVFRCGYREYVSRRCFAQIRRRYEGI